MGNPNPALITDAMWSFWTLFDAAEKSALLGGIYAAKAGYHSYRARLPKTDYSTGRDVANDKLGPSDKASAIDLTMSAAAMKLYTKRLADAARARDPRLYFKGEPILREFIGTLNGSTVYCWVFTGGRALGVGADSGPDPGRDKSHLWHLHLSVIRKFTDNKPALLQILSILKGEQRAVAAAAKSTPAAGSKESDVTSAKDLLNADVIPTPAWQADHNTNPSVRWMWAVQDTWAQAHAANTKADRLLAVIAELQKTVEELRKGSSV
ncbi:MAG: hypothetical protein ABWY93_02925 [Mycobacterium sp.]